MSEDLKINNMIQLKIFFAALFLSGAFMAYCNGQDFRIVGKSHYQIVDTAGFYLYSINKLVQGEKIARPQTVYYFSVGSAEPLMELTVVNLENAFSKNTRFRYGLEAQFHSDKELTAYDGILKMYKIKYLYRQSFN
jgi:hypothetical protein